MNVKKTKYVSISGQQNMGQNRDINIVNMLFENVSQLNILE
jgi:flagellar biogenesis protein FliO